MKQNSKLEKMSLTLKMLVIDMVQAANSGHPGSPMGLSDLSVVLGNKLNLSPKNPNWINRDRLIFSGGHCSALLYSLLYLWGFDLDLEDLKSFRKLNSKTPGHPEFGHTEGVEITTGPLGQGIANSVGFAMASTRAKELLGTKYINHKVVCICGDGDLQEGISYEAASIAGKNALDNLIIIYDSNNITIEGAVDLAFNEDVQKRFEAQNFIVLQMDGHSFDDMQNTINKAYEMQEENKKPVLIISHTRIGKGALELEGSAKTHGAPLGAELIEKIKKANNLDPKKCFSIDNDVLLEFRKVGLRGDEAYRSYDLAMSEEVRQKIEALKFPPISTIEYPTFAIGDMVATRVSNGKILNQAALKMPNLIGGSADLAPSNNTNINSSTTFPKGVNIHFGIREHAMASICNAMANYGLFLPFCATFFVFSDYMIPSIRIAAIMKSKVFYVFTHDSIGVGEDGATHQPIEHLSHLRAMPNLYNFRPMDANENIACFKKALNLNAPCSFILSRQNLEVFNASSDINIDNGANVIIDVENPALTLIASGSEVSIAIAVAQELQDYKIRVISIPCYELFDEIGEEGRLAVLKNKRERVIAIEASRGIEWYKFAANVLGMSGFGVSGKGDELFKYFKIDVASAKELALKVINA